MGGQRAGGDVEAEWNEFPGDFIHVGDHQEQPLGSGERGTQRAGQECSVQGTGGTAFGLHFHHTGNRAPQVFHSGGRPFIGELRHRRGWRDRIDGEKLVQPVCDGSNGFVGVERAHGGFGGSIHAPSKAHLRQLGPQSARYAARMAISAQAGEENSAKPHTKMTSRDFRMGSAPDAVPIRRSMRWPWGSGSSRDAGIVACAEGATRNG